MHAEYLRNLFPRRTHSTSDIVRIRFLRCFARLHSSMWLTSLIAVLGCGDGAKKIRAPVNPQPIPAPVLGEGTAPASVEPMLGNLESRGGDQPGEE